MCAMSISGITQTAPYTAVPKTSSIRSTVAPPLPVSDRCFEAMWRALGWGWGFGIWSLGFRIWGLHEKASGEGVAVAREGKEHCDLRRCVCALVRACVRVRVRAQATTTNINTLTHARAMT